ncbi:MAG: UDP-N-acetylmuramoyl-L-alanyl-D-glutamate--2,6-diaminopimelate ligase [Bdellovibrionales bacterium]|nr:UDP-N-acetylmuramoyl-L-alanyl-D-glutamate--2,6-diaminopimelate ligase [Bdellovibrionales bacterium]
MKLAQLLSIYPQLKWGQFATHDVVHLCDDSRKVTKGSVFVAVRGYQADGHNYLAPAIAQGAIALIVEDESSIPESYQGAVVKVENTRHALNQLASKYYGDPAKNLFCIGVTGTNGKTSITYLLEAIFNKYGWKTGVMGTIDHHIGDQVWKTELTTPSVLELHRRLQEFVSLDAKAAVFEVSSHALTQHRVDGLLFQVGIFTNLTRDHLDYHKNLEEYFLAKQRLFKELPLIQGNRHFVAIINSDDEFGKRMEVADGVKVWTYGKKQADYSLRILEESFAGVEFHLECPRGTAEIFLPLPGEHNVYNAVAAIAAAISAGVSLETCKLALESFAGVPGRLQKINNDKGLHVFVDYAHTDKALESVLLALRKVGEKVPENFNLITVFGCGGDRDPGKRPLMMTAAKKYSDTVFLTSDNPRTEDPLKIINDAMKVVSKEEIDHNVFVEPDRKRAIERAIHSAQSGDVILIAGKGHEDYQIIGREKVHFSDAEVVREFFKNA